MAVLCVVRIFRCFPRPVRRRISDGLAIVILKCAKKTRLRAIQNVRIGMPDLTKTEVNRITYQSYQTICFGVIESFWMNELPIDLIADASTRRILDSGQGASIATMHMSCYEIVSLAIARMTGKSTTMSNIPPFLNAGIRVYKEAGINCIHKREKGGFLKLVQAIKQGQFVTLHADHFADDTELTFFGQSTKGPCGAAMLSALANRPLLIAYATLTSEGRYQVYIETFSETGVSRDKSVISATMQSVYDRFETIILQHPEQWYWSYNRWRTPLAIPQSNSTSSEATPTNA
ncbi:lysophospholipid acyltransferase family protein [Algicola sagamiensis]|uniref:lysophospholipid acyltransferase family protein n=1 Tax=Algicola sagamiensis TaxID=163869 RepID=UPI000362C5F5|nr:hypothetical protein [Algicola sagamiensis]